MRDSFVLFTEIKDVVEALTNEQRGKLFKAILDYESGEQPEIDDDVVRVAFIPIKRNLDKNNEKWEQICEARRQAGSKGGKQKQANQANARIAKAKTSKNKQTLANQDDNEPVNDTDTVNDNDNEPVNEKKKDIPAAAKKTFGENQKVKLTDREYELLVAEYGVTLTNRAIEFLDAYITDKGYKSKSNYLAIRRWVIDAVQEKRQRAAPDQKQEINDFFAEIRGGTG